MGRMGGYTRIMICPNCGENLKKGPKSGEGAWTCASEACGEDWFILRIPKPGHLKSKRVVKPAPKEGNISRGKIRKAIESVKDKHS